jgi:polynucleotide 5'-kinase involved in rRNA processing
MPLTRDQWRAIYNAFNPQQRLEATDRDLFVERPDSTSRAIVEESELEPKGKWVLCGSMGSGKSSELVHLSEQLGRRTHATIGVDLTLS